MKKISDEQIQKGAHRSGLTLMVSTNARRNGSSERAKRSKISLVSTSNMFIQNPSCHG